mgnify:CR=1 FL=1
MVAASVTADDAPPERWSWPLRGPILARFGEGLSKGIDIGGNAVGKSINGATIVAAAGGKVIYAGYRGGYGNCIIIDHGNGVATLYAHMQSGSFMVSQGQTVERRDSIGRVGSTGLSTGPHLHFEVRINGTPVDPMPYLK